MRSEDANRRRKDTTNELPTPVPPQPASDTLSPTAPLVPNESIAFRAYQLFVERGGEHGHDVDDWLRAERELRREAAWLTQAANEKPAN